MTDRSPVKLFDGAECILVIARSLVLLEKSGSPNLANSQFWAVLHQATINWLSHDQGTGKAEGNVLVDIYHHLIHHPGVILAVKKDNKVLSEALFLDSNGPKKRFLTEVEQSLSHP